MDTLSLLLFYRTTKCLLLRRTERSTNSNSSMTIRPLILCISMAAFTCVGLADRPIPFATDERFVTVVQAYGGAGPHWTVWAVQPGRLTIYTQSGSSGRPDKLLARLSISREQEAEIRRAAATLRRSAKGRAWYSPDIMDGISLSVSFSIDGTLRDDDIVLENVWRPEFKALCESISGLSPSSLQISFSGLITSESFHRDRTVVSIPVRDYYNR